MHTHTHPFNGPFSRTTRVSRYQKGKTNLDFNEARVSEWQWHQLGHMQVCISLQTDNHASTPPLFFTGRMPFLPPNQQCQSTEGSHLCLQKILKFCFFATEVTIFYDHNLLMYLWECASKSAKLTHWAIRIQEFSILWSYRPGSRN